MFNQRTQEAEERGSLSLKLAWATDQVSDSQDYTEILVVKNKQPPNKKVPDSLEPNTVLAIQEVLRTPTLFDFLKRTYQ